VIENPKQHETMNNVVAPDSESKKRKSQIRTDKRWVEIPSIVNEGGRVLKEAGNNT